MGNTTGRSSKMRAENSSLYTMYGVEDKLFNLFLSFLICVMGIIATPTLQAIQAIICKILTTVSGK